jgi:type VI protein secretion system component Hcp
MAGDEKIDAFLYFGTKVKGDGPNKIDGETGDIAEKEATSSYGKSMSIKGYQLSITAHAEGTEETQKQDGSKESFDPEIGDVEVTRSVDAASPFLLQAVWKRTVFSDAWIVQKKAGGGGREGRSGGYFWEINLNIVVVKSLSWNADQDGGLVETLHLGYQGIETRYYKQKHTGELEKSYLTSDELDLQAPKKGDGDSGGGADAQQIKNDIYKALKKLNQNLKIPPTT